MLTQERRERDNYWKTKNEGNESGKGSNRSSRSRSRSRSVVGTKSHPALVGEEKWRSNRTPISQSSGFQVGISFSIPYITYRLLDSLADTLSPSHVATLNRASKSATPPSGLLGDCRSHPNHFATTPYHPASLILIYSNHSCFVRSTRQISLSIPTSRNIGFQVSPLYGRGRLDGWEGIYPPPYISFWTKIASNPLVALVGYLLSMLCAVHTTQQGSGV